MIEFLILAVKDGKRLAWTVRKGRYEDYHSGAHKHELEQAGYEQVTFLPLIPGGYTNIRKTVEA